MKSRKWMVGMAAVVGIFFVSAGFSMPVRAGAWHYITAGQDYWPDQTGHPPWNPMYRWNAQFLDGPNPGTPKWAYGGDDDPLDYCAYFGGSSYNWPYLTYGHFYEPPNWGGETVNFTSVLIVAYLFNSEWLANGTGNPDCYLKYSIDNRATWNESPMIPTNTGHFTDDLGYHVEWNVTAEEDWTPDMLVSENTYVMLSLVLPGYDYYWVDYIGFDWTWTAGTWTPPDGIDDIPPAGSGNLSINFGGILGLCGFAGMIAILPYTVYVIKQGEPRIRTVVLGLATGMIFFVMFLGSLG